MTNPKIEKIVALWANVNVEMEELGVYLTNKANDKETDYFYNRAKQITARMIKVKNNHE